jgi:nucleoside-triphosphatase
LENGMSPVNHHVLKTNILLTGPPGCGKTTLIEKIVQRIGRFCTGFITREMRQKGKRVGFAINTLSGEHATMAHIDIRDQYRVGRYGVDLQQIDRLAPPAMIPQSPQEIVVVDEIGKMKCLSRLFRKTLLQVLDGPNIVLGSISLKGDAFISAVKHRPDVRLMQVSPMNRETLDSDILGQLPKRYL